MLTSMSIAALLLTLAPAVSVQTLLPEMTDMMHLTERPNPAYTTAQASSYDRKSNPGPNSDPFANADAGQFLRTERTEGRTEYVMADLKGPGAAVRVWSANPAGTVRFYFDGEPKARIEHKMVDLLSGKVAPFTPPFAYGAAQGFNLYFPLPYAKSLKVTVDDTDENRARALYYHVGFRSYAAGTAVKTFTLEDLRTNSAAIARTRNLLNNPQSTLPKKLKVLKDGPHVLKPHTQSVTLIQGSGTIRELKIKVAFPIIQTIRAMDWSDPHQPHNVLRSVLLSLSIDGKRTVSAPLGDFFGTAPGINPVNTLPFEVRQDGTLICRLPIPYRRELLVTLQNTGQATVPLSMTLRHQNGAPQGGFYTLHTNWKLNKGSTRPMRDMNFLNTTGEGYWVGSNLHIANPTPTWWGEGDEKVYVDNEAFPSTFGTGTEDYYGYAWCSPQLFNRPYHSQPRCDGPGNFGHSNVNRWHILDPIPYRTAIRFDMEMWHWQEVEATFAHTAFWYAPPSQQPALLSLKDLLPPELKPAAPVAGALEGEKLRIIAKTGGTTENQGGFWELSAGEQLWWKQPQIGEKLVLAIPVKEAGTYELIGNFCRATDYGIHKMRLNGNEIAPIDFYGTGVSWKKHSLGTFELKAGDATLEIECLGKRSEAAPGNMFGLDYLLLERKSVATSAKVHLDRLFARVGGSYRIEGRLSGKVTEPVLASVRFESALALLLNQLNATYTVEGGTYTIRGSGGPPP